MATREAGADDLRKSADLPSNLLGVSSTTGFSEIRYRTTATGRTSGDGALKETAQADKLHIRPGRLCKYSRMTAPYGSISHDQQICDRTQE